MEENFGGNYASFVADSLLLLWVCAAPGAFFRLSESASSSEKQVEGVFNLLAIVLGAKSISELRFT